jgi:hypothetical protein
LLYILFNLSLNSPHPNIYVTLLYFKFIVVDTKLSILN